MSRVAPILAKAVGALLVASVAAAYLHQPAAASIRVIAEFERAGLNVRKGDEVRVRGVPVGRIAGIELDEAGAVVRYTLRVDPDARVAADTTARLVPKTLFGDKFVELQPAPEHGAALADGAVIPLERTAAATEVQTLLDELVPVLRSVDPVQVSNTLASFAEGVEGRGSDIHSVLESLPPVLEELTRRKDDLSMLFRSIPGVAGTVEARATELARAAEHFGDLADLVVDEQPELARFLDGTTALSAEAAALLTENGEVLQGVLDDGYTVLDIVSEYPGAITALLDGAPRFVNGLAAATSTGSFRAPVANFVVLNPGSVLDAPGSFGEAQGGAGIGPDIVIEGLELPTPSLNLGPAESSFGLGELLGSLLGGSER
ncbi:MAG: MlaD family protein [Acidimicrobiales bacterium]|nr:MlaD family protein [Acidimicrobiales bacterium]